MTTTKIEYPAVVSRWYSSAGSRFNSFDLPGVSCFLRQGDAVYHTYSTYARGGETVGGAYYFLDLTALGRQEEWEEPKKRTIGGGAQAGSDKIRYPDEY